MFRLENRALYVVGASLNPSVLSVSCYGTELNRDLCLSGLLFCLVVVWNTYVLWGFVVSSHVRD